MRGLAFPSNAVFDRETSYEYGSPFSNVETIPIDPALGGPAIGPAIMAEGSNVDNVPSHLEVSYPQRYSPALRQYSQEPRQYPQGPQGDPFAPQPPAVYLQVEPEQPLPAPNLKPVKKKRKPRREEDCGFCQGNDSKNKNGEPELMITCEECGRSGHPSCMELADVSDVVRSYPWKCIECKSCELCHEKGDDERILFCDFCDRGWHMDCMVPRIETAPNGKWHCPECPALGPDGDFSYPSQPELQPENAQQPPPLPIRESSIASSSRSFAYPMTKGQSKYPGKGKGKARAMPTDDSELEFATPSLVNSRNKQKSNKKSKPQRENSTDDDELSVSPPRQRKRMRMRVHSPAPPLPRIRLRLAPQKGKGKERDDDEPPKGLFDGILRVGDRDTTKTVIQYRDKQWFERSRLVAEEKLAPPAVLPLLISETPDIPTPGPSSRPLRSSALQLFPTSISTPSRLSASPAPSTPGLIPTAGPASPTLRIRTIRFGQFDIKTWYDAPFPEEYATIPDGRLWICEFCLKYMKSRFGAVRHRMKCKARHPPGDEIYRDGTVSIFEVDGRKNKIYCQNLCLLSKMFLDHKSLFYDVEPFLFYVITEMDDFGARFVGYFSKEKRSPKDYNVSCIMTLPVRQRQGWGNLLIDFSYLLSKKEQRLGSPEKPLSSLGALGYRNYWTLAVMRYLETAPDQPRLADISAATSMTIEDVHATLTQQNMISMRESTPPPIRPSPGQSIKFPKGRRNGVARRHLQRTQTKDEESPRGPFVAPTQYDIHWDRDKVDRYLKGWEAKGYLKLKPEKLKWSPFLLARMKKTDAMGVMEMNSLATTGKPAEVDPNPPNGNVGTSSDPSTNGMLGSPSVVVDDDDIGPPEDALPVLAERELRASRSPHKEVVRLEQDGVFARDPLDTPKRQLRSRPNQFSAPSVPLGSASMIEERPTRRRPVVKQRIVNDDEALATKLALEEQQQGRQLRSRAESTQELKRMVSASSRVISPRKRRRVDSSPEIEDSPPPSPLPVTLTTPVNGKNGGEVLKSILRHKPSRLINGSEGGRPTPQPLTSIRSSSDVDAHPSVDAVKAIKHITGESNIHVEEVVQAQDVEPDHDNELDMKSEDLGTPLTSLTSRQSLPSDDTIFAADATTPPVNLNGKDPNGNGTEGHGVTSEVAEMIDGNDDECDIDAEGECDEDAEGEPDIELIEEGY